MHPWVHSELYTWIWDLQGSESTKSVSLQFLRKEASSFSTEDGRVSEREVAVVNMTAVQHSRAQ